MKKTCKYCDKEYSPNPKHSGRQKYCSQVCFYNFLRKHEIKVCEYCGREYRPNPQCRWRQKFCGSVCHHGYMSKMQGGKNHWNWKGGLTSKNAIMRASREFKQWSHDVKERDGFRCQICGQLGGYLNSHHILAFALYEEYRFDVDNGITLHSSCHRRLELGLQREDVLYVKLNRFLGWRIFGKIGRLV